MKKTVIGIIFLFVTVFSFAETKQPVDILKDIDSLIDSDARYSVNMDVIRGEKKSSYALEIFSHGKDCVSVVKEPLYDKGTVYLMKDSNSWIYYPRNKKTIRTGNNETVLGSDFTFNEVAGISLLENYTPENVVLSDDEWNKIIFMTDSVRKVQKDGVVLRCSIRDGKKMSYPEIRVYALPIDGKYYAVREDFFTLSGKLLGVILFENIGDLDGKVRPCRLFMYSTLNSKNYSILEYEKGIYNAKIPDVYYTSPYMSILSGIIH